MPRCGARMPGSRCSLAMGPREGWWGPARPPRGRLVTMPALAAACGPPLHRLPLVTPGKVTEVTLSVVCHVPRRAGVASLAAVTRPVASVSQLCLSWLGTQVAVSTLAGSFLPAFHECRVPKLLSQVISREQNGKWSSRNANQLPHRMPGLAGGELACYNTVNSPVEGSFESVFQSEAVIT